MLSCDIRRRGPTLRRWTDSSAFVSRKCRAPIPCMRYETHSCRDMRRTESGAYGYRVQAFARRAPSECSRPPISCPSFRLLISFIRPPISCATHSYRDMRRTESGACGDRVSLVGLLQLLSFRLQSTPYILSGHVRPRGSSAQRAVAASRPSSSPAQPLSVAGRRRAGRIQPD